MNNFLKIAAGVDIVPLLTAIQRQPELWNENSLRTSHELTPHKEVSDIWVWFNDLKDNVADAIEDLQTVPYPAWDKLPQLRPILFDLMRRVEGVQLGRCVITRLEPGKKIEPHIDQGTPATFYTRFQVALQCEPGCNFIIDDEQVNFRAGEVWMINNRAEHSVINNSSVDRIALIIDVRCA
jgi:hypothetical protein